MGLGPYLPWFFNGWPLAASGSPAHRRPQCGLRTSIHRWYRWTPTRRRSGDVVFLGRVLPVKKWTVNMVYYGLLWFTMVSPGNWDLYVRYG